MASHMISYSDGSRSYDAYLAPAASGKGPGIVVLQEWWGLVDHIKDIADRFAEAGFTALAPDLYEGKTAQEPDDAATLMQALNISSTEAVLAKAIEVLLENPATEGEVVGCIGFCMGGQLALFAASKNPRIVATADFYGIHPNVQPDFAAIQGSVLGIFAEHDGYASPEAVRALDETLTSLGKPHAFTTYPGTHHAFFNDTRPTVYDAEAAADAWRKTIAFFEAHLRG